MTDCSLVKNELACIMNCGEEELEQYMPYINNSVSYVSSVMKNADDENDARIIHLCAVRAFYCILLTQSTSDGITSFKAGDVSYTMDMSALKGARVLLDMAVQSCSNLIKTEGFAFEAV